MKMSQQPMLVKALDGKNITILEAGQYHNAAVADGVLYTWGYDSNTTDPCYKYLSELYFIDVVVGGFMVNWAMDTLIM